MRAPVRSALRALALLIAPLGVVATGCAGPAPATGHVAESLATLPDCSYATVSEAYVAAPSDEDGIYVVRDGMVPVCATDFDGLEALDRRLGITDPIVRPSTDSASSDPMPGRGSDPASMPASSDPMPGHGTNPAASDPMPGRNPEVLRATTLAAR